MGIRPELRSRREIEVSIAAYDDTGAVGVDADSNLEVGVELGGGATKEAVDEVAAGAETGVHGAVCGELNVRAKVKVDIGIEGGIEGGVELNTRAKVKVEIGVEGGVKGSRASANEQIADAAKVPLEQRAKVQSGSEAAVGCDDKAGVRAGLQGAWDAAEALRDIAGAGAE